MGVWFPVCFQNSPLPTSGDSSTGVWLGGSDNGHHGSWAWFPTGQLMQVDHSCSYKVIVWGCSIMMSCFLGGNSIPHSTLKITFCLTPLFFLTFQLTPPSSPGHQKSFLNEFLPSFYIMSLLNSPYWFLIPSCSASGQTGAPASLLAKTSTASISWEAS